MGLCVEPDARMKAMDLIFVLHRYNTSLTRDVPTTLMRLSPVLIILCTIFSLIGNLCLAQSLPKYGGILVGVFDGRTPCRDLARQLNENVTSDCIKIKWRLTLYKDSLTNQPTTYELIGFSYRKGNPRKGDWKIIRGTKNDPEAVVYQLNHAGGVPLFFYRGDENILFFLDQEKKLMIGNKDFSYTLNRIK
jgi:NlpE N-terminal domain